jgi:predicted RNase H-like HicB family nuclease
VRSGRRGRRVPALSDVAARLTTPGAVPTESAQLVNLLVSLAVAFAVELGDRGWIGPLPGTSTLISPADTFDDAIALAMQAIEEHSGVAPLVDALRAGRPRMASA